MLAEWSVYVQAQDSTSAVCRRRWVVRGQVQGVGFRPFTYRLANDLGLKGFVRNESSAVVIEVEGSAETVATFGQRLQTERPAAARYEQLEVSDCISQNDQAFRILTSEADTQHRPVVTVDMAVCPQCLQELRDPADFRYRYPLINCTHCGPRYTIIREMPYDRSRTTMSSFGLCEKCHQQYSDATDRRFHAQPVACPACGPRVGFVADLKSATSDFDAPIAKAAKCLIEGQIVAIKGLGGFHLACRADDDAAVQRLRERKQRDSKPFAVMCASAEVAQRVVHLSKRAMAELTSPAAPIVLAEGRIRPQRHGDTEISLADAIAPESHRLGVVLPYTPLHHLLFAELAASNIRVLVMTSANVTDEPLVKDNDEAVERLADIADAVLLHERPIERSVDDSVLIDMGDDNALLPIRRARGYVPQVIRLSGHSSTCQKPGLCVGGELKNTVAVVRGDEVILSHHLGDLKHTLSFKCFKKAIEDMCRLFEVRPAWIAHDLHPAYLSTQWAGELAKKWDVPTVVVQHHHAHAASVLAEHDHHGEALAIVCDGVGYGTDGSAWGGELLRISAALAHYERLGHLRPIPLAGGDVAARETRRCAAGVFFTEGACEEFHQLFTGATERMMIERMLTSGRNVVQSSAAGRLFDAAASILGVCDLNDHEARAAMRLEALAAGAQDCNFNSALTGKLCRESPSEALIIIDLLPYLVQMGVRKQHQSVAELAREFHEVFAQAWAEATGRAANRTGIRVVALSGGVFCNEILTRRLTELLEAKQLTVLRHRVVPPNDGGIALGQAAIATALRAE